MGAWLKRHSSERGASLQLAEHAETWSWKEIETVDNLHESDAALLNAIKLTGPAWLPGSSDERS
jgi:hypothetical protein